MFIDDREANVVAARAIGMVAICWSVQQDHAELVTQLADLGVGGRLSGSG